MDESNSILIYDIETSAPTGLPDATKDELRVFGCYSYITKKSYLITDKKDMQKIIDNHKFLVGFNTLQYDNIVLERSGINTIATKKGDTTQYKIHIDLFKLFDTRASQMKIKEGILNDLLMEYTLKYICETIHIVDESNTKGELDYNILKKQIWSSEDIQKIKDYTLRDIEITKKLYEWCEDYFSSFKEYIKREDVDKKCYLRDSLPKIAYKAICKELGWTEEYNKDAFDETARIKGGLVCYAAGEYFSGDMWCLDFASLYPHAMIQANLFGRENESDKTWHGGEKWEVEGYYNKEKLSTVGELLKKWFKERVEFKKIGDSREYSIKIFINIIYGILNNIYYSKVYDKTAGGDCTRLGRQWIVYGRKQFTLAGFKVIYTDTDSIYVYDYNKLGKDKMLEVKNNIVNYIKSSVPFPQSTFDMKLEDEIKYMYFFKGGNEKEDEDLIDEYDIENKKLGLMKKNYIYVAKDNKLVIKNLGIRKKSNSPLSRKIFWEYLVPEIKKGTIKFSKTYIQNLMTTLLQQDFSLAVMRKEVGTLEHYSKSLTGLAAQISAKYGAGIHFLVPVNKKMGVGKGKHYITLKEFNDNKFGLGDLDMEGFWSELDYFIKPQITKNIFEY